ncbi:MAG: hypothetical protein ABEJ06_01720 [Haloarculaceae archaeon]
MDSAAVSRRARRFVVAGVGFLLLWEVAALVGVPRATQAVLGVFGFVLHVVFGKAYALVPSYFDRPLAAAWPTAVQLPATAGGALALAWWTAGGPPVVGAVGGVLWAAGVAVFVGTLAWTVRDNPTGAETGTSEANARRRPVDRAANAVVPVALGYLLVGSYEACALAVGLPRLLSGGLAVAVHLLAVGMATTTLLAVGVRLLPRFLVASPPRPLVGMILASGAVAPALLVGDFYGTTVFRVGAVLEAVAVVGFAALYAVLFVRTDRDRVGFFGVLAGVASGVGGVALGLHFALAGVAPELVVAHLRLNVLGLLGLSIVGVAYQFYPPAVGAFPGCSDRTALASIGLLAGGLWVETAGRLVAAPGVRTAGLVVGLGGAVLFAYLLAGVFRRQAARAG